MQLNTKKKIATLEPRKPFAPSRLIKCYVCNQHFDSQPAFDAHLKLHQNKLNRDNQDELQRKTQESFRKSKATPMMGRTLTATRKQEKFQQKEAKKVQVTVDKSQQEKPQNAQEQQFQQALRQSIVLLQRLQMITQPWLQESDPLPAKSELEQLQLVDKYIKGQRELYKLLRKTKDQTEAQKYIISTSLETKALQNYQEQLLHLRSLITYAVAQETVKKISKIKRHICQDVITELNGLFQEFHVDQQSNITNNLDEAVLKVCQGEITFCSDCFERIEVGSQYYLLPGGQCIHKECWQDSK